MRSELAVLAIWMTLYIALMLVAMFLTAVGLHILR